MAKRPSSDAHRRAVAKWNKANAKTIAITLMTQTESDVIEKMESVDNKRQYFIYLVRKDIEETKRLERMKDDKRED